MPQPQSTLTAKGARTRAALVTAARTVFERDGFVAARIVDIASEAGVAVGSFYGYFDGKTEILTAVLEEAQQDMLHPGELRAAPDDDPVAVIRESNRAYFTAYRRNVALMRLLEQVAAVDPEFRAVRRRRSRAFVERNARAIRELQEAGLADRQLDPTLAARALSGMVGRLAYSTFAMGERASIDELVDISTRLWANALGLPMEPVE